MASIVTGLIAAPAAADSTKSHPPVTINPWEASGFCLTADASSTTSGTISLLPCTDTPSQRWYLNPAGDNTVTIENAASHLVLERAGGKLRQSELVASNPNQVWQSHDNQIDGVTLNGQPQQWTVRPA